MYNEGDAQLPGDALEYFLLALAGVGVVVLLMLVNPWTAILLMCAVGLVDLFLFGRSRWGRAGYLRCVPP